ncbi:hypothetical protein C8R43DRAFT_1120733 [Mycena crocata]|nr:hypothetical protein C8R43DRAFT_1120733 [Mycena crocata]
MALVANDLGLSTTGPDHCAIPTPFCTIVTILGPGLARRSTLTGRPPPKMRRNRAASSQSTDASNGEVRSAVHQRMLAKASDADDIRRIITTLPGIEDGIAGEFNRRFDRLYGEDCRDAGITELEHLCASNEKHRTISASAEAASTPSDNGEKVGHPAFEARMDYIFYVAVNPKNADKAYNPKRKHADLSEEEEDDFDIVELDEPAQPPGFRKRKLIIVGDGNESSAASGRRASKKKAKKASAPHPKVTVIEIDDESDDEQETRTKRGPKNTSRDISTCPKQ